MASQTIRDLTAFLDRSKSVYHAAANLTAMLDQEGYTRLEEGEKWSLTPGGKYYVNRGSSAFIAFRIPLGAKGFLISASHCDRPSFKIKENAPLEGIYTRLATEPYGGMLMAPWLDRPLSVAGRALVETENGIKSVLVDIDRDLLLIPNVAIHMNRKANEGYAYNPACDTVPLLGGKDAGEKFQKELETAAGGKILGHDLYLYVRQKASVWGMEEEFLSGAALDDLQCAWSCTRGFLSAVPSRSVPVLAVLDSEEVGSHSVRGAASTFLRDTLQRICACMGWDMTQKLSQSFLVSADNAHAIHPNHPEYADAKNAPVLGGGVVLKFNANLRYTTDGVSAALWRTVCGKAGVPVQTYFNRADIPGGSTLGCVSMSQVSIPTADIGLAQLAMHSCYETASTKDTEYLVAAMTAYYSSTLTASAGEYTLN